MASGKYPTIDDAQDFAEDILKGFNVEISNYDRISVRKKLIL